GDARIKTALGLLAFWVMESMISGLWGAATAHDPNDDMINSHLASLMIPGAFLPGLLLAAVGFRIAWILAAVFLAIDVLNKYRQYGIDARAHRFSSACN